MGQQQHQQWIWSPLERKCLSLLQQRNTKSSILQIQAFMLRNALQTNLNLLTKFITTCSSISQSLSPSGQFSGIAHARRVFDHRPERNDCFLCTSMIKAHVGMRQFSQSFALYRDLRRDTAFVPDNFTLSSLAKACGINTAIPLGKQIHDYVVKIGFCLDLYISTALLDMYAKFGEISSARKVFDEMIHRSLVSWTALIGGYAKSGDMDNAKKLFDLMPEKDLAALNMMIDAYVKIGDMGSAKKLFDEMPEKNVVSWTSMIYGYCDKGDVDTAKSLFEAMPEKNLVSWNVMIGGYSQNKKPHESLKLFHELQLNTSLEPDSVTIVSILPAIADLGALELGGWVHRFVQRKKLDRTNNICTALVDMYAKCGEIEKAKKLFDSIKEKEIASWNAMINGFAVNGYGKEALEYFSKMKKRGFKPNEITMIGVLVACNHSGLIEEGKKIFKEMEEFGLSPKMEHYGCIIDLLGRAGLLEEAEKLIKNMPFKPNGIILSSFMHSCGKSRNVSKAEKILNNVMKKEPRNDGNYIMLKNMYAADKRWSDVENMKDLMRKNRANKEVGCSVIEFDCTVCEFMAGDRLHQHWSLINSVLQPLCMHMKKQDCF